jgi:hypothetical protein
MKRVKALMALMDVGDVGLVLLTAGLLMMDVATALVVIGVIMILDHRPLRSWF